MSLPPGPLDIYLIAIGGTGMAPLACLLKGAGHRVRGSDGPLYSPMSELLASHDIRPLVDFDPAHLDPLPDLVVVGNAVPRTNPEVEAVERSGIPRISMPEALARFFLAGRRPLVVAGTHGKTTTSTLAAWAYTACGRDPGYLLGGMPLDLPASFRCGGGDRFVVEGDEYNAAYFDRGPKFLHYRPQSVILTSVEHDHADLYPEAEGLLDAYRRLLRLLPPEGLLVACGDTREVRAVAREAGCRTLFYGLERGNTILPVGPPMPGREGTRFRIRDPEAGELELLMPMPGAHSVANALAVWAVLRGDGVPAAAAADAIARFRGVRRRVEEIGQADDVTVVDDFAHHPTAVATTLAGLRQRYPGSRLVALFEPRSLTAGRAAFHAHYLEAFTVADAVIFAPVFHAARLGEDLRLDLGRLASELGQRGVTAAACPDLDAVLARALAELRAGDVAVTMSSGAFGAMAQRLVAALRERAGEAATVADLIG